VSWPRPAVLATALVVVAACVVGLLPARARAGSFSLPGHAAISGGLVQTVLTQPAVVMGASSQAWYCVAPPLVAGADVSAEVVNAAAGSRTVRIGPVASDAGGRGRLVVAGGGVAHVALGGSSLAVLQAGGGVGAVTVVRTARGSVSVPCESTASDVWSVLGFDTRAGAAASLRIANPFATPAVVDVDPIGQGGTAIVTSSQGLVVAPGESITLDLTRIDPDQGAGAVEVVAKNGRVVVAGATRPAGTSEVEVLAGQPAAAVRLEDPWVPIVGLRGLAVLLANPGGSLVRASVRIQGLRQAAGQAAAATERALGEQVVVPAGSTVEVPLTAEALAEPASAVAVSVRASGGGVVGVVTIARRGVLVPNAVVPLLPGRSQGWLLACAPGAGVDGLAFSAPPGGSQLGVVLHGLGEAPAGFESNLLRPGVIGLGARGPVAWIGVSASAPVGVAPVEPSLGCGELALVD